MFRTFRVTRPDVLQDESVGIRTVTWGFEARYPLFTRIALVGVWILGILAAYEGIYQGITDANLGNDAHAYWLAVQGDLTYDRVPGQEDAYLYSPAFALLITPLGWLPWPVFLSVWIAINAIALIWLLAHVRLRWAVPFFLLCVPELVVGNVFLLIAACLAMGLRRPAVWAFPILTKVTTGIGLLWFVFRRQWRPLATALLTTALVIAVAALFNAGAWIDWLQFLTSNTDGARDGRIGFTLRVIVAVALMWWGARTGRTWVIAVSVLAAAPVSNLMTLTILVAIPRLAEQRAAPMRRSADAGEQTLAH